MSLIIDSYDNGGQMYDNFTDSAKSAIAFGKKEAKRLKHTYFGSEHILLGILSVEDSLAGKILKTNSIFAPKILELIEGLINPDEQVIVKQRSVEITPRAKRILENAELEAKHFRSNEIGTEHILIAMLMEFDCVATRLLATLSINMRKVFTELLAAMGLNQEKIHEEFQRINKIGRDELDSSSSNTPHLDAHSTDLTAKAKIDELDPIIGRDTEIFRVLTILSRRTKNNACLVGLPGVGKTAVVEGIANAIASGNVPRAMLNKRLLSLDISGIVAGSKYRGEFEERMKNIIREATGNDDVILFIDELHRLIGAGGSEGSIDAASMLKPAMARGELQIIGATTLEEYRKYIEKDAALERRFQPVHIEEPTVEEAIKILQGIKSKYEEFHNAKIDDEAILAAVEYSVRYINDRFLPDKAIDLIDEALAKLKLKGIAFPEAIYEAEEDLADKKNEIDELLIDGKLDEIPTLQKTIEVLEKDIEKKKNAFIKKTEKKLKIGKTDIAKVVSDWTKLPLEDLQKTDIVRLRNLEKELHHRVISQNEAVEAVSRAVKRGRTGFKDPKRPIGSFLFLGPTGVGKTELSKALAESVFGAESALIRIDMSEYMEKHSVAKIIGSPPGYIGHEDGGQLSEKIKRNPYSVLLLDEIEKAHPDIFNILLQVLDDGHITDSHGRKISFKNTIIIMTSNVGAKNIVAPKSLGFISNEDSAQKYNTMKTKVMDEVKKLFKPEMLNRIDEVIVFHELSKDDLEQICELLLKQLSERVNKQLGITLIFNKDAKKFILEKGYDKAYGARQLKRAIQSEIENRLADALLDGKISKNSTVNVEIDNNNIIFNKKNNDATNSKRRLKSNAGSK